MKTEFEIASAISNYITSNEGVTDFPVTLKQISDEVDTLRVRLMQEMDSKVLFKKPFYNYTQTIFIGGLSDQLKTSIDAYTRRRYVDIPRLFMLSNNKPAIAYCGSYKGEQNYRVVAGNQREWFSSDRWIGKLPTVVVYPSPNNSGYRLDFRNISPVQFKLEAVFEDPSDMEGINGYDGTKTAANGGTLYPMPSGDIDVMIGKTVNSYMQTLYRHPVQGNQTVDAPGQKKEPL